MNRKKNGIFAADLAWSNSLPECDYPAKWEFRAAHARWVPIGGGEGVNSGGLLPGKHTGVGEFHIILSERCRIKEL